MAQFRNVWHERVGVSFGGRTWVCDPDEVLDVPDDEAEGIEVGGDRYWVRVDAVAPLVAAPPVVTPVVPVEDPAV